MITWERLTIDPEATEPVTAAQLAAYGRITDPAEIAALPSLISAAREETERLTGRILLLGTFAVEMNDTAALSRAQFPIAPIVSFDSFTWVGAPEIPPEAARGAARALADVQWADPTIVPLIAWQTVFQGPPVNGGTPAAVAVAEAPITTTPALLLRLKVTAGYRTPEDVPEGMRQFVLTLALLRFTHRDDPAALQAAQAFAASAVPNFGVVQI